MLKNISRIGLGLATAGAYAFGVIGGAAVAAPK